MQQSWVRDSIAYHRRNGTLAGPVAAYDSATGLPPNGLRGPRDEPPNALRGLDNRRRKSARDQAFMRVINPVGVTAAQLRPNDPDGVYDQEAGSNGPLPPEQCADFVRMMLARHAALDAENETDNHNQLVQAIAEILLAEHNGGTGDRKVAQDRAIRSTVRSMNSQGFAKRFPDAAKVSLAGNGR